MSEGLKIGVTFCCGLVCGAGLIALLVWPKLLALERQIRFITRQEERNFLR